ncbi:hypothetical protein HAX54_001827 [Datura stramonium]|uniref:Uncharacterized protein n=1 Tax=Datura stramonium TaxID=4076 RepID=A0ABS8WTC1_DATST|nr:hypothetical protein [Datura stramonium]
MGRVRVHMLGYMKQASHLASTNYDEGDPFGLALALQRQHRQQRTASNAGCLGLVFGMRCQSICTYDA